MLIFNLIYKTINYKKNPDKIISLIGLKNEKDLENHLAEIDLDLLLPLAKESDYITVAHSEKEIIEGDGHLFIIKERVTK